MPEEESLPLQPLIAADQLAAAVAELAEDISRDFRGLVSQDQPLLLVGVLKGAVVFMADLARALDVPVAFDFIAVSSYGASTSSSGVVRILHDLDTPIEGRRVIVVEDIVDTGLTLRYLREYLQSRGPADLRVCTLLDKPGRRKIDVKVDYRGLEVPDRFLVGYGLDFDEKYRNLPYIAALGDTEQGET